jgi:hypothetical protein
LHENCSQDDTPGRKAGVAEKVGLPEDGSDDAEQEVPVDGVQKDRNIKLAKLSILERG